MPTNWFIHFSYRHQQQCSKIFKKRENENLADVKIHVIVKIIHSYSSTWHVLAAKKYISTWHEFVADFFSSFIYLRFGKMRRVFLLLTRSEMLNGNEQGIINDFPRNIESEERKQKNVSWFFLHDIIKIHVVVKKCTEMMKKLKETTAIK